MPMPYTQRKFVPRRPPMVTWLTAVFIMTFTFGLFMLANSAIAHHFFSGERMSTDATVESPSADR